MEAYSMENEKAPLILVVEDNDRIRQTNSKLLIMHNYRVREAASLEEARMRVKEELPDIVVLDIMLPDGSGIDFCKELRKHHDVYVLFLSALGGDMDLLKGYDAGAEDYLAKPYSLDVFLAKIEVLVRRMSPVAKKETASELVIGNLRINFLARRAYVKENDMLLKSKEFSLLNLFVKRKNTYIGAEEIYRLVWGADSGGDVRTVRSHIFSLRRKLEDSKYTIETRRGLGYRFTRKTGA